MNKWKGRQAGRRKTKEEREGGKKEKDQRREGQRREEGKKGDRIEGMDGESQRVIFLMRHLTVFPASQDQ